MHAYLRRETAQVHSRLDEQIRTLPYFESRVGYADYLRRLHTFQSSAEETLERHGVGSMLNDWPERRRSAAALADLASLGVPIASRAQPGSLRWLISDRPEHLLGTVYVLEGATLGGAVLLRTVARLGITAESGGAFLASYGRDRGRMWQRFLAELAAWDERGISRAEVVNAALAAFDAAATCLGSEGERS